MSLFCYCWSPKSKIFTWECTLNIHMSEYSLSPILSTHYCRCWVLNISEFCLFVEYSPSLISTIIMLSTHKRTILCYRCVLIIQSFVCLLSTHHYQFCINGWVALNLCWALTFKHFSCSVEYSPSANLYQWVSRPTTLLSTHLQLN